MSIERPHRWQFFRAGGFDQVQLNSPADLAALRELDQKLWATLACPTEHLEHDPRLLAYIDADKDGRIRAPEVLAAVDWALARLADPGLLFRDEPVTPAAFGDDETGRRLALSARRLLEVLGREADQGLSASDTDDMSRLFPPGVANGDGLVPVALAQDENLKQAIADIIRGTGGAIDRSGDAAVSAEHIDAFFAQARELHAWEQRAADAALQPFGEHTPAAIAAIAALRDKIDDYFTRIELVAFDARAASLVNGEQAELARLSAQNLADAGQMAALPLAAVASGNTLPLEQGVNPAWADRMRALREHVITPVLGQVQAIDKGQWEALKARCHAYFAWQAAKPAAPLLQGLTPERIGWLVANDVQAQLLALVERDKAVAEAADGLLELDQLLRYQRGLMTLLRNFVSFQDFYGRQHKAVFQAGRLYIDGKSCDLVVEVKDIEAHAAVAANSSSFLLYCVCSRRGQPVEGRETLNIVAAVTAGDEGSLSVGRNGLFYDRDGNDWDATVVKVLPQPISVREAFWSPYRRVSALVSAQIQKLAADRDAQVVSSTASAPAEAAASSRAFDIARFAGIFAAIGLAVGALGTALAAIFSGLLALRWWQFPLLLVGLLALISGPSMLVAWFKLRRRNLGPILDANGWAVNTAARISIGFGASLTQLAKLPEDAVRSLRDPYTPERPLWPWLVALALVAVLAVASWYTGGFRQL